MGFPYIRKTSVMDLIESSNILVLQDDFTGTFLWTTTIVGGFAIARTTAAAFEGSHSVYFDFEPGILVNDYAQMTKDFSFFSASKYHTRFYFKFKDTVNTSVFGWGIDVYANFKLYSIAFRYLTADDKFQFLNSAGVYTDFPSPSVAILQEKWQGISFEFDLKNLKYGIVRFGMYSFDLSDEDLYSPSSGLQYAASSIFFKVTAGATPSHASYLFLDNLSLFAI